MGKVLLAINGTTPDKNTFQYAVDLCLRIKADLKVLQIVSSHDFGGCLARIKQVANKARYLVERTMAAAAFAEVGEFETAEKLMDEAENNIRKLLPQTTEAGIGCDLTMSSGKSTETIINFVRNNKDILVTVYDTTGEESSKKTARQIKKEIQTLSDNLPVPVVVVPGPAL